MGLAAVIGCSDGVESETPTGKTLGVSFSGLSALGPDFVYEGWLIVDGAPVSTGRFDVADGKSEYTFEISEANAADATDFVLSIEPAQDSDPGPAKTKVLGGSMLSQSADLAISHGAALKSDLTLAAGNYILETPTSAAIADDYGQGIWFLDPNGGNHVASLNLPALPEGWVYEGWVVGPNGPISTGRFSDAAAADWDGAGPTAGSDGSPPFPGQDFIDPAVDLTAGYKAVITVEPEPDNSPMPYDMKPLIDDINDMGQGGAQSFQNQATATNPTGIVDIR